MKFDITFVLTFALALAIALLCAYLFLRYLYGDSDPRKWKSLLFNEKDTYRTVFFPNKGKGRPGEKVSLTERISHNETDEPDVKS